MSENDKTEKKADKLENVSLTDIYFLIHERWQVGLGSGIFIALFFIVYFMNQDPRYTAETVIYVEAEEAKVIQIERVVDESLGGSAQVELALNNQRVQMESRNFITFVLETYPKDKRNALFETYIAKQLEEGGEEIDYASIVLNSMLDVDVDQRSQIIYLSIEHTNPEIAADFANYLVDQFIMYKLDHSSVSNESAITFLNKQAEYLKAQVELSELSLLEYRRKNNLISLEESQSIALERVNKINDSISELDIELVRVRALLTRILKAQYSGAPLIEMPEIFAYGSIAIVLQNIDNSIMERANLATRYLERHHMMIANAEEYESLKKLLEKNVTMAIADFKNRAKGFEAERGDLTKKLRAVEEELLRYSQLRIESNVLTRVLENNQMSYEQVLMRLNETNISSQLDLTNIRILDYAIVPKSPSFPNIFIVSAGGGLILLFCLAVVPIGIGLFDNRVKTPYDVEIFLDKYYLGSIPVIESKDGEPVKNLVESLEQEALRESFLGFYTQLQVSSKIKAPKVLLVCSTISGEGKTFTNVNLGATFARQGLKTVLLDCDFRRPSLHKQLSLKNTGGVIQWFESEAASSLDVDLEDPTLRIVNYSEQGLDVISAGGTTEHPSEIVDSKRFGSLISKLKETYDIVLMDSPPIGLFPDGVLLTEYVDEIVYLCRYNHVSRNKVRKCLERLEKTGKSIVGILLAQTKKESRINNNVGYGSYSQEEYRKYYSKSH